MTLKALIDFVDALKENTFSYEVKTVWVNEIEGQIQTEVHLLAVADVVQYVWPDNQEAELIVAPPYDKLYRYYLEAMIAFEQEEMDRYQNIQEMFQKCFLEYVGFVASTMNPANGCAERAQYYLSAYGLAVKLGYTGTLKEWLESLKGNKGDPFRYEDFTTEQLESLTAGIQDFAVKEATQKAEEAVQGSAENAASQAAKMTAEEIRGQLQDVADEAENSALKAESWAVGGTGTRAGEDTNNAKYWASQAQAASGGGVTTFNGRSGAVFPQTGDYTANMVGAVAPVIPAVAGNLATLSATGDLQDSGLLPTQAGVRKNLLDNWYFVGGGTDGNFPVNQRAITDYTNGGYNVDRWICNEAGVSAVENGISIPAGVYFFQRLPGKLLAGKTVTMSVLFADGDLVSGTGTVSTSGIVNIYPLNNNVRLYSENNSETNFIAFVVYVGTVRTISAMKLELGETQTLARQTDSGWEILEIPDYGTELAKCQRYLLVVPGTGSPYAVIGTGSVYAPGEFSVNIPTPVALRTKPSVEMSGNWVLRGNGIYQEFTPSDDNVHIYQYAVNNVVLDVSGIPDITSIEPIELLRNNDASAAIILTAEL